MIKKETIYNIVEAYLINKPLFLVDVTIKARNNISVFIDSETSIGIDDCVSVSKHIDENLNRDEEDFALEVSSAGIDSPFKVFKQYQKNIGKQVKVLTTLPKEFKGELLEVKEEEIILKITPKKKSMPIEQISIPFKEIKTTTLILTFK